MAKNQYKKEPLKNNVEEMFIGPFGSSLKNECFVDEEDAYCMVYEQKHAIQKTLDGKNRFVDKNKYYELKRFTIKPGDIIVSCRGTIGETFIVPENAPLGIMHPSIMKIRLKPNVYNIEYFNLLLKNRLKDYNKSANGSGIKMAISATELGKELFPIPPMDEQQKTSKIFLMVNHLILLRKQQLAKLDELVKARFVEMFGDPIGNTKNLPVTKFVDVVKMQRGFDLPVQERKSDGMIPVYGSNGVLGYHDISKVKGGGVITGRSGTIGKVFYEKGEFWPLNTTLFSLNLHRNDVVYLKYLLELFDLSRFTEGTGVPTLNRNKFHDELIIDVPLDEQERFAAFVERVDQQKQTVQQSLEKLELMKKALMQEYFG